MQLTEQQIQEDDERYSNRDILRELRYCGNEVKQRKNITEQDIRYYAWLCRAAYKQMMKVATELMLENEKLKEQFKEQFSVIREKAKAVHDAVTELDSEVNL